jgi:undecaprenyl-diphosphatase
LLARSINQERMMSWDQQLLLFAAAHRTEGLDHFFRGVTWLGSLSVLGPVAALSATILLSRHKRGEAALLVIGVGGAALLAYVIKAVLDRPRPALLEPLIAMPTNGSFPSAHTMQIVAFALCMVLILRRSVPEWQSVMVMIASTLIVAVAASRVYLQVHYPSDVLGGIVLGIAWVALVRKML